MVVGGSFSDCSLGLAGQVYSTGPGYSKPWDCMVTVACVQNWCLQYSLDSIKYQKAYLLPAAILVK